MRSRSHGIDGVRTPVRLARAASVSFPLMSRTMMVLAATLLILVIAHPSQAQSGLVSWYKADGNAIDDAGPNQGIPSGNVSYVEGVVDKAFKFGGAGIDGIMLPDSPSLAITKSLTISAFVFVNQYPAPGNIQGCIVFRGDQRAGFDPYVLSVTPQGSLLFHVASLTGIADMEAGIAKGKWVAVTATLDDATGLMSLYQNGFLVNRIQTSVRPFATLDQRATSGVAIGNCPCRSDSPFHQPFDGMIDEVKIFNTVVPPNPTSSAGGDGKGGSVRPGTSRGRAVPGGDARETRPKPLGSR